MLEAFVKHKSLKNKDRKWYSLGVFTPRDADRKLMAAKPKKHTYHERAEDWRKRAEIEYGRPVKLVEVD